MPEEDVNLPPKDDLQILLNRIEMQLPKDDHVKYDSRYDGFHLKYADAEGFIIFLKLTFLHQ